MDRLSTPMVAGVFLLLGLLLYAPVITSFFLSDDFFYLSQIVHLDFPNVLLLQPGVFRPLHVVSLLVDYHVWALDPLGYHLTNIVSHCLAAVFVFIIARQLFDLVVPAGDANWAAGLAGLVFLVHPSHTEAVSWIIGRHDIFAAIFFLFAWYAYVQFQHGSHLTWLAGSLCALLIALLFKESPLSLPLILIAYEGWLLVAGMLVWVGQQWQWSWRRRHDHLGIGEHEFDAYGDAPARRKISARRTVCALALYVLVIAIYFVLRRLMSGAVVSDFESPFLRPSLAMFGNLSATLFRSLLPYVPVQLLPEAPKLGLTTITVAVVGIASGALALFWIVTSVRRPSPVKLLVSFLVFGLILSAIPTLAFGRPSIIDSEAERYVYLPSTFAAMLVGLIVAVLVKRHAVRAGIALGVLVFFGVFLELSNQNWRAAGELTSSILESMAAQPGSDELAVLVVPDDVNGAFVYRNGLPEALALFGPEPGPKVNVAGWAFLKRADERIALDRTGDAAYAVSIPAARGTLVPASDPAPSGMTLTRVDLYRFDVSLKRPVRVAYYSAGRMHFDGLGPG